MERVRARDLILWILRRRQRHRVAGASMLPELRDGDEVLVDPRARPEVGDVVLLLHPTQREQRILKRVAELRDDGLYLLGDNPEHSTDSRHFGVVPPSRLLGKVVARF